MSLPSCRVHNPSCGTCGSETRFDGDYFLCDDCGLNYGDGKDFTEPEFIEEVSACGAECSNFWHGPDQLNLTCGPCELPKGHASDCWTDCK
jgi:hypothetical protein